MELLKSLVLEENDLVHDILGGKCRLQDVPDIPAKVVRVYMSATWTDTVQERNALVERVYPKLREYCREKYGHDFQVVDLRWGVQESWWNDHSALQLHIKEIQRCKQLSSGPNFMVLFGQRYGRRPLPARIVGAEYDIIRDCLLHHKNRDTREQGQLDIWYKKDTNANPHVYILQPINSVITDFNNNDNEEMQKQGKERWEGVQTTLRKLLQLGVEYAITEEKLPAESKHKYCISELESEVIEGIGKASTAQHECQVFVRKIVDLKNYINEPITPKFMEVTYDDKEEKTKIDSEVQDLLTDLIENKLQKWSATETIQTFQVLWRFEGGINPTLHKSYLDQFSNTAHECLQRLIDDVVTKQTDISSPFPVFDEVRQHMLHYKNCCQSFFGREDILDKIHSYILYEGDTQPLVLYGDAGSGKSAIIGKAIDEIGECLQNVTVIVRQIGLTPASSDIRQILHNICTQLACLFGFDVSKIPAEYKDLLSYFQERLRSFPEDQYLVILLDNLDVLAQEYNAHFLYWIPKNLNFNVKIIVTTSTPDETQILHRLQNEVIKDGSSFVHVDNLSVTDCTDLLQTLLNVDQRSLTMEQTSAVQKAFAKCGLPLFVKLVANGVKTLSSYEKIEEIPYSDCTSFINAMFDRLELKHGSILTSHAIAYIAASHTGLSDCEIEDLLSLDEVVMNEVLKTSTPTVRRLPPLLWLHLRSDIDAFMVQKEADGVTVFDFSHRLFCETIKQRYLSADKVIKDTHSCLADYFLGTWHGTPKPYDIIDEENATLTFNEQPHGEADRFVPSQPLTFQSSEGTTRFNKRKYDQVPLHLLMSGRRKELNQLVLFNYEWLYNKMKALSLQHIIQDFALNPSTEASLLEDAMRGAQPIIESNIDNMAIEISGRLMTYYATHSNIRDLIRQCDKDGLKRCALIPNFPYHQIPGSPLQYTIQTSSSIQDFFLTSDSRYLLAKARNIANVHVLDIATGEHKNDIIASSGDMFTTPDGNYLVIVDHVTEKTVKVHKANSGEFLGQLIPMNHIQLSPKEKYKMNCISVSNDFICLIVTTESSYLCIADVHTCKFLQILGLDGKTTICEITPDSKCVFCNSNEHLMSYDLTSLVHISTIPLEYKPSGIIYSKDSTRAFVFTPTENKVMVAHINNGYVELTYKIAFEDCLPDDRIKHLKLSNNEQYLLVRGLNNIALYNMEIQQLVHRFQRPNDIPKEFKLPKSHYTDIAFTQADFSREDKFVLLSIFRNVYVYSISNGKLITTLQAPVGIIADMMIPKHSKQILTHLQDSCAIHVWNFEAAINQSRLLDKLTGSVAEIQFTEDASQAFVRCHDSDEVGVIDMTTGQLQDLLTHESPVTDLAISPNGEYTLVSLKPKKPNCSNKIWYLGDRKVIKEFGNVGGHCISFTNKDSIAHVCQKEMNFKEPYHITLYSFDGERVIEKTLKEPIKYVLIKPFITPEDKYLVIISADDYDQMNAHHSRPTICAVSMEERDFPLNKFNAKDFTAFQHVKRILHARPIPMNPYSILVLFNNEFEPEDRDLMQRERSTLNDSVYVKYNGFLILDIRSGVVTQICDNFLAQSSPTDDRILFSKDTKFCLDNLSNVYDTTNGYFVKNVHPQERQPKKIALNGEVIVYCEGQEVIIIQRSSAKEIARCDVHSVISCVELCEDQRTLVIGCEDGTIVSYVIIDEERDAIDEVLAKVPSRAQELEAVDDGRMSRTWDKVDQGDDPPYSRPPSVLSLGPRDKERLRKVKPVPRTRPQSDTVLYINQTSKTCSIM
ncbi:unnamed protein product [Owenia fusiformis]|uniref:NACHT domain-containing protein n=1 Tax=Owenia fusiformis TaxID=6347 RepID=A0A8J1Y0P0_OWEFU|nr:unnamed protein product [Owenia fusiformis]